MLSYLVLDYNRPREAEECLRSLKAYSEFKHQIIYLSNGGEQDYVLEFYRRGWIDRLILNRANNGLGFGTTDLFRFCDTPFAIYVQNDQILTSRITQPMVDSMIQLLESNPNFAALDLAGHCAGPGIYSERPHLINVALYNSIPGKPNGGCGPHYDKPYNEGYIQEFLKQHGMSVPGIQPRLFEDNGTWTVRETPCGGIARQNVQTGQLWWDRAPKSPFIDPKLTAEEWDRSIRGDWNPGSVPLSNQMGARP